MKIHPDNIQERLLSFELLAISELFCDWAIKSTITNKLDIFKNRIELFRKDILGSKYALKRETVPHELTSDECDLCSEAVKQARKECSKRVATMTWLKKFNVKYEVETEEGKSIQIYAPFPAPPIAIEDGIQYDYSEHIANVIPKRYGDTVRLKELVFEIVGYRFGIKSGTVADHKSANNRYKKTTPKASALLATIFLDLNFYKDTKTQIKILNCLLFSKYSLLKLYYLIQISHSINWQMSLRQWEQKEIDKLCDFVCPDSHGGPFTKLFQA